MLAGLAQSRYKVQLERGQLAMIAGPPGGGKTALALIMALRMGVPTLYVAADSDELVMAARVGAALSGHRYEEVRRAVEHGVYDEVYGRLVNETKIRFLFDPSEPSLQDIVHALTCWLELWGSYPELIVIDNLINIRSDDANEWAGLRKTAKDLHFLARKTKAAVVVLHHTTEGEMPTRSSIQGKITQLPSLIMTVYEDEGSMLVWVVKQRSGLADKNAKDPIRMMINFDRMKLHDVLDGRPVYFD